MHMVAMPSSVALKCVGKSPKRKILGISRMSSENNMKRGTSVCKQGQVELLLMPKEVMQSFIALR